jgi:hypothetical protein
MHPKRVQAVPPVNNGTAHMYFLEIRGAFEFRDAPGPTMEVAA